MGDYAGLLILMRIWPELYFLLEDSYRHRCQDKTISPEFTISS
jgi:hypothetical protein